MYLRKIQGYKKAKRLKIEKNNFFFFGEFFEKKDLYKLLSFLIF